MLSIGLIVKSATIQRMRGRIMQDTIPDTDDKVIHTIGYYTSQILTKISSLQTRQFRTYCIDNYGDELQNHGVEIND